MLIGRKVPRSCRAYGHGIGAHDVLRDTAGALADRILYRKGGLRRLDGNRIAVLRERPVLVIPQNERASRLQRRQVRRVAATPLPVHLFCAVDGAQQTNRRRLVGWNAGSGDARDDDGQADASGSECHQTCQEEDATRPLHNRDRCAR